MAVLRGGPRLPERHGEHAGSGRLGRVPLSPVVQAPLGEAAHLKRIDLGKLGAARDGWHSFAWPPDGHGANDQ